MLSGPDLGAGFLYQLTRRREGPRARFTFHAQEGGQDASGPPIGTPEPFGWSVPSSMCSFGGRQCWHRTFETDDLEVAAVRAAYNRTRFVMAAQLSQAYRGTEVLWASALEEWAGRVVPSLEKAHAPWRLTGTASQALQGRQVKPRVVTISTTPLGVRLAAEAIPEYLVEPPAETVWGGRRLVAARAFIGSLREGTRVEWAEFEAGAAPRPVDTVRLVGWNGRRVPVEAGE